MKYEIEDGITPPRPKPGDLEFHKLKVGQSFFVPLTDFNHRQLQNAQSKANRTLKPKRFSSKLYAASGNTPEGVRFWRDK